MSLVTLVFHDDGSVLKIQYFSEPPLPSQGSTVEPTPAQSAAAVALNAVAELVARQDGQNPQIMLPGIQ